MKKSELCNMHKCSSVYVSMHYYHRFCCPVNLLYSKITMGSSEINIALFSDD